MDLKELIAELGKLDKDAVIAALQGNAVYQGIFDKGHATATSRHQADKTALETRVTDLEGQVTDREKKIRALEAKTPDAAQLQQQHETVVAQLTDKHKQELKQRDESLNSERMLRAESDLRAKLKGRVDTDYVEVLITKTREGKRIRLDKDGKAEALQADNGIPFAAAQGKTSIDLLADELFTGTPTKFQSSNVDGGSGTEGGGGGGSGSQFYEGIRKDTEKRQVQGDRSTARERMGVGGGSGKK